VSGEFSSEVSAGCRRVASSEKCRLYHQSTSSILQVAESTEELLSDRLVAR